jgi:hypothetical protein
MIHRVDLSKPLWRYLYHEIYDRIWSMGVETEWKQEEIINRILRLQSGDTTLHLLVELKDNSIISHCLVNVLHEVAFVEQAHVDRRKDNPFIQECEDYISTQLKQEFPQLTKIAFSTHRSEYRAFERKYGFSVLRVILQKDIKPVQVSIA